MSKLRIVNENDVEELIEVTMKPMTIRKVNALKKVESENEDQIVVLKFFVENCINFSTPVDFESIDILSLAELVKREYMDKMKLSEK